jgi:pyrroline-5-carboxylate reductase
VIGDRRRAIRDRASPSAAAGGLLTYVGAKTGHETPVTDHESRITSHEFEMNVTFIGGGNMASAIIGGLRRKAPDEFAGESIHVVEISPESRNKLERAFGVACFDEAWKAVRDDDIIIFAVKPQDLRTEKGWLRGLPPNPGNLVISIAAGVRLSDLARWLDGQTRLIRAMPNTPALIGEGITALYPLPRHVSKADMQKAEVILGAVGQTVWVRDEKEGDDLMNAVTAVSGSGPAYVFLFMEAMEQAASELRLPSDVVHKLVIQTFVGAARLVAESADPLPVLRERVTSRGGTTEAALKSMARDQVKDAIVRAVKAANDRGRELGDELGRDP